MVGIVRSVVSAFCELTMASLSASIGRTAMERALKNGRTIIRPLDTFKAGIQERRAEGHPNHVNRNIVVAPHSTALEHPAGISTFAV